jgi:hypothetical protein
VPLEALIVTVTCSLSEYKEHVDGKLCGQETEHVMPEPAGGMQLMAA